MGYGGVRNKRIRKFERSLEMKQNAKRHKNNLESTHFSHDEAITIGLTEKDISTLKVIDDFDQDEIDGLCSHFGLMNDDSIIKKIVNKR